MSNASKLGQKLPWNYKRYFLAIIIFAFSCSNTLVTKYYQPYFFSPVSAMLRTVSGNIGLTIGEWLYLIICISLIISFIRWVIIHYGQFMVPAFWGSTLVRFFNGLVKLYIVFELFWGLNYQKQSPAIDFGLIVPTSYTEAQMDSLSLALIRQLNNTRAVLNDSSLKNLQLEAIFEQTRGEYIQAYLKYPFLHYRHPSLKIAAFPILGDYFGYTAFYQPLTGEAIIRGDLPLLTQPFTVSHEMAHQLGYASETEANFIAFVIGTESKDPLFNYSTHLQLFTYAQLAQLNSIAKRGDFKLFENVIARNKKLLNPKVLADRKQIRDFFSRKQDLQIPGSTQLYNQFLQWNKQAKGIESYNDVLLWSLAYKKHSNK